jgi:hypothetical protein
MIEITKQTTPPEAPSESFARRLKLLRKLRQKSLLWSPLLFYFGCSFINFSVQNEMHQPRQTVAATTFAKDAELIRHLVEPLVMVGLYFFK